MPGLIYINLHIQAICAPKIWESHINIVLFCLLALLMYFSNSSNNLIYGKLNVPQLSYPRCTLQLAPAKIKVSLTFHYTFTSQEPWYPIKLTPGLNMTNVHISPLSVSGLHQVTALMNREKDKLHWRKSTSPSIGKWTCVDNSGIHHKKNTINLYRGISCARTLIVHTLILTAL